MRAAWTCGTVVLLLIVSGPLAGASGAHLVAASPSAAGTPSGGTLVPLAAVPIPREALSPFRDRTLGPVAPETSAPPTSAYPETPSPLLPPTTPVVVTFPQYQNTTPVTDVFTAPVGTWGAIVFNYTGTIVGDVYDSSYRAYVDDNQFLEGTTPEYGTWTVAKDLIEYASLFHGTVNVTFLLGAATLGGHFVTNITMEFYPTAPGTAPPVTPTAILPILEWNHTYLSTAKGTLWYNATVPDDVTNATLQLFVYGFGPTDEFWYTDNAQSPYRQVFVTVGGHVLASVLPFPYINTGGVDLFLWRPVTGSFTIDDRPFEIDVSGSLGSLEGTHEFGANISGGLGGGGNTWLIGGSLLLYTSPTTGRATQTAYATVGGGSSYTSGSTAAAASASFGLVATSSLTVNGSSENVTSELASTFTNDQKLSNGATTSTQNVTMSESLDTSTWTNSSSASVLSSQTLDFPYTLDTVDSGTVVSQTSTTETINFTSAITKYHQEWAETDAAAADTDPGTPGGGMWQPGTSVSVDDLTSGSGTYSGQEVANKAGGGATISALYGSVSSLAKTFSQDVQNGYPSSTYLHQLSASADDPPGPYNAMTLLGAEVSDPVAAAASLSSGLSEVGGSLTLGARAVGGTGDYSYTWSGLPPGCTTSSTPSMVCAPSSSGVYDPSVTVSDSDGAAAFAAAGTLIVDGAPNVTVVPARTGWDVGQDLNVSALVVGGTGQNLTCAWTLNLTIPLPDQPCGEPLELGSGDEPGDWTANVTAWDSAGVRVSSAVLALAAVPDPTVAVVQGLANTSALFKAGELSFNASVVGGSAPYAYVWSINGVNLTGPSGPQLLWTLASRGTVNVTVWVTDAAGWTVGGGLGDVAGGPVPAPKGTGSTSPTPASPTTDYTGWYVALAAIAADPIILLVYVLAIRPAPKRPPSSR